MEKHILRAEIEKIVDFNIDNAFGEAHYTFNTGSGDISPEQEELLSNLKMQLTDLMTQQVHDNL